MAVGEVKKWQPVPGNDWRAVFGRWLSLFSYPALVPYAVTFHGPATADAARWWRNTFTVMGLAGSALLHGWVHRRFGAPDKAPLTLAAGLAVAKTFLLPHWLVWASWDLPYWYLRDISRHLIEIIGMDRKTNRLNANQLHGPRVLVVGNGPSAVEGDQFGDVIDKFDEVVRFNNFQCKVAGLEKWVGTKTTVHFSDGVLYPTFTEYHAPGATIVLSLFVDRFFVAGSYCIMRAGSDLQYSLTYKFLKDPGTTWIDKDRIERLKKALGLVGVKHPTSGMLAIDYFVNKPGVQLPVVIHGFDFFQGPKIHYYHDQEPWYERFNNNIGVNMHSPHKEKIYVEQLIAEGKVVFLKDAKLK